MELKFIHGTKNHVWNLNAIKFFRIQKSHPNIIFPAISFSPFIKDVLVCLLFGFLRFFFTFSSVWIGQKMQKARISVIPFISIAIDWEIEHKIFNYQLNLYSMRDQGTKKTPTQNLITTTIIIHKLPYPDNQIQHLGITR